MIDICGKYIIPEQKITRRRLGKNVKHKLRSDILHVKYINLNKKYQDIAKSHWCAQCAPLNRYGPAYTYTPACDKYIDLWDQFVSYALPYPTQLGDMNTQRGLRRDFEIIPRKNYTGCTPSECTLEAVIMNNQANIVCL